MKYSEVQKECKRLGINAKGSLKELKARLAEYHDGPVEVKVEAKAPEAPAPIIAKGFVFVGDTPHTYTDTQGRGRPATQPDNPPYITMYGYSFQLNGAPVDVSDDVARKLRTNSHFKEV
jgi:hypothetical protein